MDIKNILIVGVIAFLSLFVSCSNGQEKSGNEKSVSEVIYDQEMPEFDITFPKTDFEVKKTETRDSDLENALVTKCFLEGKDENGPFMYFVTYSKMPNNLKILMSSTTMSQDVSFKAMLTGSAEQLGGTDFLYTKIKYKDFDGMESICNVFDGDGIIKSRVYKINDNIFMISAGGRKISIDSVNKFLDSFELKTE